MVVFACLYRNRLWLLLAVTGKFTLPIMVNNNEAAAMTRLAECRIDQGREDVRFGGWHGVFWTAIVTFYGKCMNTLLQRNAGI